EGSRRAPKSIGRGFPSRLVRAASGQQSPVRAASGEHRRGSVSGEVTSGDSRAAVGRLSLGSAGAAELRADRRAARRGGGRAVGGVGGVGEKSRAAGGVHTGGFLGGSPCSISRSAG